MKRSCALKMIEAAKRSRRYMTGEGMEQIQRFLLGRINSDGGFQGRSPLSDLYYSAFGIMSLIVLHLSHPASLQFERYLNAFDLPGLGFVELCSLVRCRTAIGRLYGTELILRQIERYRSSDGGYSHDSPEAREGSLYGAFLACQAYEDLRNSVPDLPALISGLGNFRAGDGGFSNRPGLASSTPATAAALAILSHIGPVDSSLTDWLAAQCGKDGGFLENPHAPMADMLSTATALYALKCAAYPMDRFQKLCQEFIALHWDDESGGFFGNAMDPVPDCEYTFYALLALGSLW